LAELAVLDRWVRPLSFQAEASEVARALSAAASLDTATLICLTGRWPAGRAVIAWAPAVVVGHHALTTGSGWLGYQAYDEDQSWWGRFDVVLRQDLVGRWSLEATAPDEPDPSSGRRSKWEQLAREVEQCLGRPRPAAGPVAITDLQAPVAALHLAAVEQAVSAIRAGALFQVNVCARYSGLLKGDPLDLFTAGAPLQVEFGAFLRTERGHVVSFSPELFLRRAGRVVTSAPIKGTRRREDGVTALSDPAAVELAGSTKDRAENVMITDLVRNDLSRVCRTGSVRTPTLLRVRPGPGVWHLVSEVTGELRPGVDDAELLAATFPPGSVTGAPKIRAQSLIAELERARRGVFTGCVGYLDLFGETVLNVAIRTFEFSARNARSVAADSAGSDRSPFALGVGGGITAGSTPMAEWLECLVKAAPLLALGGQHAPLEPTPPPTGVQLSAGLFDSLLAIDGQPVALSDHLARLVSSAAEVYGDQLVLDRPGTMEGVLAALSVKLAGARGRHRVRLVAQPSFGPTAVEVQVLDVAEPPASVSLQTMPGRDGSWRHKWNDRTQLERWEALAGGGRARPDRLPLFIGDGVDPFFYETSRSNVVFVPERGVLATPPLSDQVLPGVTRRRLLDVAGDLGWRIELRESRVSELRRACLVLVVNATGLIGVKRLDGEILALDEQLLTELLGWLPEFAALVR
jgi:para-aminobenzoate synthetase/4-amino-4-deoxychorismate lyase